MNKMQIALTEAESVNDEIQAVMNRNIKAADMMTLRTRFANAIAAIASAIHTEDCFRDDDALFEDFQKRFFEIRQVLARHQSRWRAFDIEADTAAYIAAGRNVSEQLRAFCAWARSVTTPD